MFISFVVPTRNSARTLRACLQSLRSQDHPDTEVLVVDNHSSDATAEIATTWADRLIVAGPERSAQRNIGAAHARGDVVVFIDSDMIVEPGVAAQLSAAFEAEHDLGAMIIPEQAFGDTYLARCRALEKRLYLGDESVEAIRGVRRSLFDELGGWDESLTAGEDWDLTDRVRSSGFRVGRTSALVWHDERDLHLRDTYRKKRYYGAWVAGYLDKQGKGGSRKLARTSLLRQPGMLAADPLHAGGMFVLKAVEGAGLAAGIMDGRRNPRGAFAPDEAAPVVVEGAAGAPRPLVSVPS